MSNEFDDLVDIYRIIKIKDKNGKEHEIKASLTAVESGRLNIHIKKNMSREDSDKVTEILKSMIKRNNPTMTEPQSDAIVAFNYTTLFEQALMFSNPELTEKKLKEAKESINKEELEKLKSQ